LQMKNTTWRLKPITMSNTRKTYSADDPWTCPTCGKDMIKTRSGYLSCLHFHDRLYSAPRVEDLPRAWRVKTRGPYTRFFYIMRHGFKLWRYVPYAHKTALDQKPKVGTVVAKVILRDGRVQARVFKPAGRQHARKAALDKLL
jgi:hypothetical protein